jgi:rRNA maturation endonuclease Nob1
MAGWFPGLGRLLSGSRGADYECLSCHSRFDRQPQVCPECGGYDIRRVEWLGKPDTDADSAGENA